jgi:hypothetical protein
MSGAIVLLAYALIGALLVVLAVVFFLRARGSRRHYTCPQCGERVMVELMRAGNCNMCGAPLERS